MQRYEEFLKLPNKIHIKCQFRCIFNFCLICKVNSCHLFQLSCRPPGIRTLRNLDCLAIRWLLPAVGEIRLLLSIANHRTACVKLKQMRTLPQNNKILKLFKRIIAPRGGVAPPLPVFRTGQGKALRLPLLYGDGALSGNPDISHSMPPLYALYSSSVIPIETR